MKKVIVACGNGVATSQAVANTVNKYFKEHHINAEVLAVDIKSVDSHISSSAAFITVAQVNKEYPIPVISGIPFLTGIGKDEAFKKLEEAIKQV